MRNWTEHAACRDLDPDIFFPTRAEDPCEAAKAVCASCVVRPACLKYAMERREEFGVWGGLTPIERRRKRRQKNPPRALPLDEPVRRSNWGGGVFILGKRTHGKRSTYVAGCRCKECREVASWARRAARHRAVSNPQEASG